MDLKKILSENEFVFLDGAMGTMLQKSGLEAGEIPELLNLTNPDVIENIHRQYIDAGTMIVYANTFGANRFKLEGCGHTAPLWLGASAMDRISRRPVCRHGHKQGVA